jgi:putative intracellular protease/amidase
MKKVNSTIALLLLLASVLGSLSSARAQEKEKTTTEKPKLNVAVLNFKGTEVIDYAGPMAVFAQYSQSRLHHNIYTVAEKVEPISTSSLTVMPDYGFSNHPVPDVIVIPGGGGVDVRGQVNNPAVIKWIQESAKQARYVMSICNGAFLLAKAGLLDGQGATTFAPMIERLRQAAPKTKVFTNKRFVDNGKVITSAGLSAGIEAALHIVERIHGRGWAQAVALNMEYNWRPESEYARADLADMRLPGSIYEPFYRDADPLVADGGRDDWEEQWMIRTTASAAEMLEKINAKWAAEAGWSRLEAKKEPGATRSAWKLTDEQGKTWNGVVSVEPVAGERDRLMLTLKIARDSGQGAASNGKT